MLKQSATGMNYTVGVAAGSAAAVAGEYVANTQAVSKAPAVVRRALAPALAVLTGTALYFAQKRKNRARAYGHLAGATTGGLLWWGYGLVRDHFTSLQSPSHVQRSLQGYGDWQNQMYGNTMMYPDPRLSSYMTPTGLQMGSYMMPSLVPGNASQYGSYMLPAGGQTTLDDMVNDEMQRDTNPEATQMLAGFAN